MSSRSHQLRTFRLPRGPQPCLNLLRWRISWLLFATFFLAHSLNHSLSQFVQLIWPNCSRLSSQNTQRIFICKFLTKSLIISLQWSLGCLFLGSGCWIFKYKYLYHEWYRQSQKEIQHSDAARSLRDFLDLCISTLTHLFQQHKRMALYVVNCPILENSM